MRLLFLILCIAATIFSIIYAYRLFFASKGRRKYNYEIYIGSDGKKFLSFLGLKELLQKSENSYLSLIGKDKNLKSIENRPEFITACRTATVVFLLDACWAHLDASEEQIKAVCDLFLSQYTKDDCFRKHFITISKAMSEHDERGEQILAATDYLVNTFSPKNDAVGRMILFSSITTWVTSVIPTMADLIEQFYIDKDGRVIIKE